MSSDKKDENKASLIAAKKQIERLQKDAASEKKRPEKKDSSFLKDWVISIPSYFTDAQRRALFAGCEIVGVIGIRRLMHENTATALAYGIFKDLRKEFTKDKSLTPYYYFSSIYGKSPVPLISHLIAALRDSI